LKRVEMPEADKVREVAYFRADGKSTSLTSRKIRKISMKEEKVHQCSQSPDKGTIPLNCLIVSIERNSPLALRGIQS